MRLNRDFQEFVAALSSRNVRFLIVGGYAVAAHGHPRYTKDLDIWVWAEAYPNHMMCSIGDITAPFISLDDLRKNKLATGRLQDLADAEALRTD